MYRQRKPARNCRGAAAMAFGLINALILIVTIAALAGVANTTMTMWSDVNSKVNGAVNS